MWDCNFDTVSWKINVFPNPSLNRNSRNRYLQMGEMVTMISYPFQIPSFKFFLLPFYGFTPPSPTRKRLINFLGVVQM